MATWLGSISFTTTQRGQAPVIRTFLEPMPSIAKGHTTGSSSSSNGVRAYLHTHHKTRIINLPVVVQWLQQLDLDGVPRTLSARLAASQQAALSH